MKRGLLSLAFGLALLPAAVCADTQWTGDVDGDFNKPGNWSGGVPTTATAGVIDKTGEVGISVSASPSAKVGALSLSNAGGATTLSVTAPMALEGGKVTIGKGSEVVVGTGGELTMDFTGAAANDSEESFGIHNGGKIVVDGGLFSITNTTGHFVFGTQNNADDKATLEIKSGTFRYAYTSGYGMRLYPGTLIKMTGGTFESRDFYRIFGFGNVIDLSGDARMLFGDNPDGIKPSPLLQRDMTVRMSGNSLLRNVGTKSGNRWEIRSNAADQTLLLEMSDNAVLDLWGKDSSKYAEMCSIGVGVNREDPDWTGLTRVTMRGNAGIEASTSLFIGHYGGSTGIVEMADNTFITAMNYLTEKEHSYSRGLSLGHFGKSVSRPAVGILKMSGGCVKIASSIAFVNSKKWEPVGLVLGNSSTVGDIDGVTSVGRIEMTGGVISNGLWNTYDRWSPFVLGMRSARGEVAQSGGEIVHLGNHPLVIGLSGGVGVYDMGGGELVVPAPYVGSKNHNNDSTNYLKTVSNIYVGGASLEDAGFDPTSNDSGKFNEWADRLATGSLTVSGGVVRTACDIYVSSHGYGTLEIGKAGSIEAANLYLTNSTVGGVTAPAKLKVTLGESGCGAINLAGACQIAADAECEIDVSAFGQGEEVREIPFLSCGSVEGGFDPANVSVSGRGAGRFKLVQSETGLSVKYSGLNGLMLLVR